MFETISIIEEEKRDLQEMKKIRHDTGFSLGKLIELRKKGYKLVKI